MNEKLLQYLWNYKIFKSFDFSDSEGNSIEIIDFGKWNFDSGPDFLMAKIKINGLVLVGNIELHVKSSDWIFHNHSGNPEFENLILHAVFQHDVEIEELKSKNIPTLELKNFLDENAIQNYQKIIDNQNFIACENVFDAKKIPFGFFEESLLKKLDEKSLEIEYSLQKFQNNYEAVFFHYLAYAFGLKVNAQIFKQVAESLDFSTVNKIRQNPTQLEALFFGLNNWLEIIEDEQMKIWKREFEFLKSKFSLPQITFHPKFSKLRPPNFPTIRLSQLAALYHKNQNLFSKMMNAKNVEEIYSVFSKVKASEYWDHHFSFGKISTVESEKYLTKDFIDLVILNAVLPFKYTYQKNHNENIGDEILSFYRNLTPEKNTIIDEWKKLKLNPENASETQALLYHFKNFCDAKNCLNCTIGLQLLKN